MSSSDHQLTPLPDSFLALHRGARGRLLLPDRALRERYELCEDLSAHLVGSAQALHHDDGLAEDDVLRRVRAGLANPDSGLSEDEAGWVTQRLAELLRWAAPEA